MTLIASNTAEIPRVDESLGTLEVGKDATLFIQEEQGWKLLYATDGVYAGNAGAISSPAPLVKRKGHTGHFIHGRIICRDD